jgi:hypothetical protein
VSECDREASIMTRPWPTRGMLRPERKIKLKENEDKISNSYITMKLVQMPLLKFYYKNLKTDLFQGERAVLFTSSYKLTLTH